MKKFLAILVTFVIVLCLAGCGVNITSISLPESLTVNVGETVDAVATFAADKDDVAADKLAEAASKLELTWTSADESVATVDANGVVTGVAGGETAVTVAAADGLSATVKVNVKVPLEELEVTGTTSDKKGTEEFDGTVHLVINVKDSDTLVVNAVPENADMASLEFESADEDVVTVDAEGKLTAVANGEATVAVKSGEISTEVTVKVDTAPEKIVLEDVTLETGHTTKLEATFEGNNITVGKNLTWASSDEDVVVVDEDGTATAKSAGEATVTATNEFGQKTDVKVVVTKSVKTTTSNKGGASGGRTPAQNNGSGSGSGAQAPSNPTTPAPSTPDPAPSTPPAPDPTPAPTPSTPAEPQHYHGNGTDAGTCPACGCSYSPDVNPGTSPGYADGVGGE